MSDMPFEYRTPESLGIPPQALTDFFRRITGLKYGHTMMVLRHGFLAASAERFPWSVQTPQEVFSMTKSFVSVAVGLAEAEGRLQLDETLASIFPDKMPPDPFPGVADITLKHLLMMRDGHRNCSLNNVMAPGGIFEPGSDWVKRFLASPPDCPPDTEFHYDSGASFLLSAVIRRRTGVNVFDYLKPRLLDPLGIPMPPRQLNPQGLDIGGWGIQLSTVSMALFGQLILQRGVWQGKRLIPEAYFRTATANLQPTGPVSGDRLADGYGYQFWQGRRPGSIVCGGWGGQDIIVLTDLDAVILTTSALYDTQPLMDAIYDFADALLPNGETAAPDPAAEAEFEKLRPTFIHPLLEGSWPPWRGKASASCFELSPNEFNFRRVVLTVLESSCSVVFETGDGGTDGFTAGFRRRERSVFHYLHHEAGDFFAHAAWQGDRELVVFGEWPNTPYASEFHFRFSGGTDGFERVTIQDHPCRFYFGHPGSADLKSKNKIDFTNAQSRSLLESQVMTPLHGKRLPQD